MSLPQWLFRPFRTVKKMIFDAVDRTEQRFAHGHPTNPPDRFHRGRHP